ncbi:MAG: pilus assembly protein [Bradyrhizobium sp.]|nr:pilus assembly protein [Bradyrhizobium sp.]
MTPISTSRPNEIWRRICRSARALRRDHRGVAAVEFAMIFPLMLMGFFGTVEICAAVAIDRKVTLIARTLSDLTSQAATSVDSPALTGIFTYGLYIATPYSAAPMKGQVSEIYVDSNGKATIQWTQGATYSASSVTLTASTRNPGDDVSSVVPAALLVKRTYLIFSEVSYQCLPLGGTGYVVAKTGILLNDVSYTRPRQNTCITYNGVPVLNNNTCPMT